MTTAVVLGIRERRVFHASLLNHLCGRTRPPSAFSAEEVRELRGSEPVEALLPDGREEVLRTLAKHLRAMKRRRGKRPVVFLELMIGGAPAFEPDPERPDVVPWDSEKLAAWKRDVVAVALEVAGTESVIAGAWFHADETSPHIHVAFVPVDGGRVRWDPVKKKAAARFLGREDWQSIHHRTAYSVIRDLFHERAGREYGLARGRVTIDRDGEVSKQDAPDRGKAVATRTRVGREAVRKAESKRAEEERLAEEAKARREAAEREADEAEREAKGRIEAAEREVAEAEAEAKRNRAEERKAKAALAAARVEYEAGERTWSGKPRERGRGMLAERDAALSKAQAASEEVGELRARIDTLREERDTANASVAESSGRMRELGVWRSAMGVSKHRGGMDPREVARFVSDRLASERTSAVRELWRRLVDEAAGLFGERGRDFLGFLSERIGVLYDARGPSRVAPPRQDRGVER